MATGRQATALVVEDDRGQSELASLLLEQFDLAVAQVATAEAALEHLLAHAEGVCLVMIDIHLAGDMDGVSLARRVSVLWPGLAILVTSGDRDAASGGLPAQATFIPKPWRPLELVAAAERASRPDRMRGLLPA